jgi:hypothetical protein
MRAERREHAHWGWHALGAAAVLAWAATSLSALWPEGEQGRLLGPEELRGAIRTGEWWLGAYREDRKLGWIHTRVEPEGAGFLLAQRSHLRMKVGELGQTVDSSLEIRLDGEQQLIRFDFKLAAGPLGVEVLGRVEPGGLALELDLAGQRSRRVLPLAAPPLFDLALPYAILRHAPQAGDRFRALVFDPQSLQNREVVVEVVGPDAVSVEGAMRPAYHLRRRAAGLMLDSWLDADGGVLREELPGGLRLQREDAARARAPGAEPDPEGIDLGPWLELLSGRGEGGLGAP